jgi:hypothetical protein
VHRRLKRLFDRLAAGGWLVDRWGDKLSGRHDVVASDSRHEQTVAVPEGGPVMWALVRYFDPVNQQSTLPPVNRGVAKPRDRDRA